MIKRIVISFFRRLINAIYDGSAIQRDIVATKNASEEAVWHHVFHRSLPLSNKDQQLNIGRWAGGASFFYLLQRVLESTNPGYILEMGLGESSKFISWYMGRRTDSCRHVILEHDEAWIDHFQHTFELSSRSGIEVVALEYRTGGDNQLPGLAYQSVHEDHWKQADLIVVDGPFGRGEFARQNILDFVPFLSENRSFVIIMDDTHRLGEQKTLQELGNRLDRAGIEFIQGHYGGTKRCTIVCSKDLRWLTSL